MYFLDLYIHCPVGRKQDSGTCVKCPIGQYQDTTGQTVCKSCGVNKITTQTGSTTENQCILQCPAGTMKVSDVCIACPIGKYQDGIDSNTCKDCPQWKTTVSTGMTSLTNCIWNCPQGMKEEGNACVPCPIGQYQDEIGKKTCNVCQIYQTTNTTGSTSFTDCVPKCLAGWKGERGVCVKCPVGQFQDLVGTTFCKACPKYRTTKSMGSTSVMSCFLQCPTGTMEANGTCNDCQAGQYQDELNAKSCKSCPDHSTSTLVGLTSRDQCNLRCPAGYSEGTGTCVKCAVSYYQDTAGSTTCKPCPQYKYTQYAGATSVYQCILRCPVGTKEVSAQCEECPVDQYQDEMGKTTCKNCLNFRRTNGTGASSPDQCLSPCDMSPNFCQNGGTCLWNEAKPADGMSCACRTRFHGDSCENYTEEADRLGTVIGGAVGGSLALLLILLAILIACACWRSSPKGKRTIIHRNSVDLTEGVYNPYFFLEGKYVLNQSAKIIELVEPAETSTDHDFKKASFTNRTSSHNGSIYTKATSFLDTHEHQDSFMDVGIESDHNPGPGSNQYKSGLPYVDFMNVDDDEVGHGVDHDSKKPGPTMDGEGLYVRKIQV
ncbi:sushi, von Willebrand factor type A, EGF and pentraxin domain-containing protein 1-like [Gigantopelta aegis]|uniref:sushi, von Willebrand factor type A, EGF and pentraxin domain-containing protein 1-like n=1 Tax=Gigantopelta aegis TaxID=1735272 RepID=UPI001B88CE30|nr:sushi, von Willebrand factor type A, EGF and pentraxin domain-containing protein 1-like [Gigantopelta aegis]